MAQKQDHDEQSDGPIFRPQLYLQRYHFVKDLLYKENPPVKRLADFGCADGGFLKFLKNLPFLEELSAIDIAQEALMECEYKASPLPFDYLYGRNVQMNLSLYKGSVSDPDYRMTDLDAITCIELIEHLPEDVLKKFPQNIFGYLKPRIVVITTPNSEFNVLFPQLPAGSFRHWDHKFEWTRAQFREWCETIVAKYGDYTFELDGVGDPPEESKEVGHCTQIAIFRRNSNNKTTSNSIQLYKTCKPIDSYVLFKSFTYPKREREEEPYQPFDWGMIN